jgi:epoxyqueuosine reductase
LIPKSAYSAFIKDTAKQLGFDHVGIAKADFLADEAPKLEAWLQNNYHGQMQYMENHFDMRLDPRKLVDGAKTVISLTYNYYTDKQQNEDSYRLSKYAFGEDYHHVVKDKLKLLLQHLRDAIGDINGRVFVDSAPVMERAWAVKSGIGWIGKHSLLINKNQGSFFFLAEMIIDLDVDYDIPFPTDHCGTCTACIDACPTDAIVANKVVDGSKCISYFTIELKDALPTEYQNRFENWMFGCDICQDVCPWNRFSKQHGEPKFEPNPMLLSMNRQEWKDITEDVFGILFSKSAVKRTKYEGLKRNIQFLEP